MSNLYARAYVRGLNADLVAAGTVVYPTKIAMDIAADSVADHILQGVDFLGFRSGVPMKVAMDALDGLLAISDDLCKQAGGYSPQLSKVAGVADPMELARYEALELLKVAEAEASNPQKTEPVSTRTDKNPAATNSADADTRSATGVAVEAPAKADGADGVPAPAVTGTEHAIGGHGTTPSNEKLASFARRYTAKIAATEAKNPKTTESAPADTQSATGEPSKIVAKENAGEGVPASAVEGEEAAQKTASYLARVEKVAMAAIPYLPSELPEYAQLAHIRALSKLASDDQGKYLFLMYGAYGIPEDKALGYAQEYVKRADAMEIDEDDDDKDDKDDDTDDGSSDAAVAAALDDAASEIEAGKESGEAEEAEKTASAEKVASAALARLSKASVKQV